MASETIQKRESQTVQPERIRGGRTYLPPVDIIEQDDRLLLVADMPGVKPQDLDVTYERGQLTVHGRVQPRQSPTTDYVLREYGIGDFYRAFQVGEGLDASGIEAELRDGVLTLHLPKAKEAVPRKITIKTV
jgi:HSP20 family protein